MGYEVVVGRTEADKKRLGTEGCVFLGRHYVKMGQVSSLSNDVYVDVSKSHVVFLCGKRGSGKSYTLAVIAEGIASLPPAIARNIAVLILDTMGIFWTMKYPNERDRELLEEWGEHPKGMDVEVFVPEGRYQAMLDQGIPADKSFAIAPSELEPSQWCNVFGISSSSDVGGVLEKTITELQDQGRFSLEDIQYALKKQDASIETLRSADNMIESAKQWGLFSERATPLEDLVFPGKVSVLDVSTYASQTGTWNVRALVIGLVCQKLFSERMLARRQEEHKALEAELAYQPDVGQDTPIIWILIDEAHEFLPRSGETPATGPLIRILREGRQPGLSMVVATQQPGKVHTDVMTQADIIISHRITAKVDTDALSMLTQSYMRGSLDVHLNELPRVNGAAVVLDDKNERLYSIKVKPRVSWHGGSEPSAIHGSGSV